MNPWVAVIIFWSYVVLVIATGGYLFVATIGLLVFIVPTVAILSYFTRD